MDPPPTTAGDDRFRAVKVIFFDAGGTLFRPYPSVGEIYAQTAKDHGVVSEAQELEERFHLAWHARNGLASLTGATSDKIERDWWYGMVKETFAAHHHTFSDFEVFFDDLYERFARPDVWRLYDDVLPTLNHLKARHYRLAMISNWDHRLFSLVEGLGLSPYLETVIASSSVGTPKPGARIFEAALKKVNVPPAQAVHVGDSLEDDYHGATRAGLQAVLLDRHRKAYNGITRVGTLHEFADLLK